MEQNLGRSVVVLAGGDAEGQFLATALPGDALVIAADSGASLAARLGRRVELLVGDLDSVSDDELAALEASGTVIERHPVDKDETDLELALDAAVRIGACRIDVVGGAGGRRSHDAANLALICSRRFATIPIRWWSGRALVVPVHDHVELDVTPGALVSLVPVGGDALDVRTSGLRWRLDGEPLPAGSTRGVSNVVEHTPITIGLDSGTVVLIIDEAQEVRP